MAPRHRAREIAFQILYRLDLDSQGDMSRIPVGTSLALELRRHFEHFEVPQNIREFAAQLVAGTIAELVALDELLEKHAKNWKVPRMSVIDRNVLRMSAHELRHFSDTPAAVVIDEAVEIAKQFGTEESASFINGILDSIHKENVAAS